MRLISRFKRQTSRSVWGFLKKLGDDPAVFCRRVTEVPALEPLKVVLYASGSDVVLVGFDVEPSGLEEIADEECFCNRHPLYFSESTFRVSPVWKLCSLACAWQEFCCECFTGRLRVHCCLVSCNEIINFSDMLEVWDGMSVKVLHGVAEAAKLGELRGYSDESVCDAGVMSFFRNERLRGLNWEGEIGAGWPSLSCLGKLGGEPAGAEAADGQAPVEKKAGGEVCGDVFDGAACLVPDDGLDDEDEEEDEAVVGGPVGGGSVALPDVGNLRVQVLPPLADPDAVFGEMLGCEGVREQMVRLTALTRYNARLREVAPDGPQHQVSLHGVFQGSPGTGKTTLCQIYASLLKRAGALSKGHVVVAGRHTFVGDKWGDEEAAVTAALDAAQGGVLMIDEAYLLVSAHQSDPGRLVLQLMMPMLADERRRDIAVVLCGYKEPMQRLLDLNEGLRSRFVNVFDFPDFTLPQLLQISRRRLSKLGYHMTRQAWERYSELVGQTYAGRDPQTWGNARVVAHLLDEVYVSHAQRCTEKDVSERDALFTITAADVKGVTPPPSKRTRRIGF